jgi:membrane associated rhomboid family serine protease
LDSVHRDDLFGRLLAALLMPASGESDVLLAGYQPPIALIELGGDAPPMVLLDVAGATPDEVALRGERIVAAQGRRLLLVVAGGGADYRAVLPEVGRKEQESRLLSMYHLDGEGKLERVGGPRVPALEKAAASVLTRAPLAMADVAALIARGQKEREAAANFSAQLRGRRPWATIALVATCVLIHLLLPGLKSWAKISGELLREGQVWRLLSAAFVHADNIHLLMNMMGLWSFGGFLEPVLGWRRYLVLYGASALVGALASATFGSQIGSVGASGALWGLMVAGFALMRAGKTIFPVRIASRLRQQLVGIVAVNAILSFIPGIDKFAHFGGGVAGGLLVLSGALVPRTLGAVGDEPWWIRVLAPLTALLMASSLVAALLAARP